MKTYNLEYPGGKNFTVLGNVEWGVFTPAVDHLICFSGAMIGLGAKILNRKEDLDLAMRVSKPSFHFLFYEKQLKNKAQANI
jgi:mannosyl-oligosaccharide alpha-1,2-mannosidase